MIMPKFTFKLDPALRWRSAIISQEESRLEELKREIEAVEERKRQLAAERHAAEALLREELAVSGHSLSGFAAYRLSSQNAGSQLDESAMVLNQKIEAQSVAVRNARRDFQLLERLRDHQSEVWRVETDRQIEGEAGDSFLVGWSRRK